jgi:hypothetical protein
MNEVQDILSRYQTNTASPLFKLGMDTPTASTAPIVGLNGYTNQPAQQTQQSSSLPGVFSSVTTPSGTTQAPSNIGPSIGLGNNGNGGGVGYDSNSGTSFSNSGNANNSGLGSAVNALGMLGTITKNPTINQVAGIAGAGYGAMNGNYTGLGSYLGRALSNSPYGALAGALAGNYLSNDTSTAKFAANAALGLGIPGYGIANTLSGGWLGNSLFGTDAQKNALGQTTIAQVPGILGNLGWSNGTANTTQQGFRASEIAAQNAQAQAAAQAANDAANAQAAADAGFGWSSNFGGGNGNTGGKTGGTGEGANGNAGNGRD